jgi:hypothetical protein
VPALLAVVVLIGGGVFAAVKVSQRPNPTATAPTPTATPNTGPFTCTYRADYGRDTKHDGQPFEGGTPNTVTWGVRSVCRPTGCVATASVRGGDTLVREMVFDDVGGRWLAVGVGSDQGQNAPIEVWVVLTLQPRLDGTLAGERSTATAHGCGGKRAATFTRTGDVDVNGLPDPASQAPRVVSPAEALRGRYHERTTTASGAVENDLAVRTDCLRTGDRCMSYFHDPEGAAPLVFAGGKWIYDHPEYDEPCPKGGTSHVKPTMTCPLPTPPQDPITLLTGHGRLEVIGSGSACPSEDYDDKFVRTGD